MKSLISLTVLILVSLLAYLTHQGGEVEPSEE